ncbi:hypothetical protein DWZ60_05090 [Blautia sp. AF34-10]|nr:hypothetical protein DW746_10105 [Blautia sp. AM28-36]RHP37203.1 hypothetical protein DWZ60_05090 [Blautia sp. AF34-10]RHS48361.1 hypothetical protein DW965_05055 [Blautia sp. AM47-4]RHT63576.1 hypothetical protein DW743_09345 [Blautia sp. AM28-27]RHT81208.1 hypothetical protein DW731_10415 [Blautia sp. AM28-10]RHU39975.1 hypothetical protein DXD26_00020 [Blautia sp. TF12-31AT]RHU60434.1 hypothetical protein DXD02_00020 [Blautia sp. TF10-30]
MESSSFSDEKSTRSWSFLRSDFIFFRDNNVFFIHYMDNGFTENLVTRENVSREKDRIRIGDRGTLKIDGVSPEKIQIIPWDCIAV